ncbi:MAG: hypothetical protein KAI39_06130, partial [Desulfobulbaceae bacterium]|nr:hypothetical protein [Desulfobulbaceae bacterium]
MYNFNSQSKIPLRLSIAVSACLAPWFDDDILEKGLALVRENELGHFFFHRHVAGALLSGEYPLTIIYDKTSRIHQGFTLKTEDCSFCRSSRRKKRCEHIAALCLLSLIERTEDSPFPMPLLFQDSEWGKLAGVLHDWLSKEKGDLNYAFDDKKICIKRTAPEGGVHAQLSVATAIAWEVFNQESTPVQALKLYKAVQKISLSETERELVSLGSSSRALNRDISIWSRICALFYGLSAGKLPRISYEKESGLFLLDFGSEKTPDLLKIHLPRHRTLEIFEQLGCSEPLFSTLHPARQGAEVKMDEKGQITVKPLLWRDNRKTFLLSEISGRKFGNSYFFPGEGFFTLSKGDPKGKICRPHKQDVNPLFDFLEQDLDFTVADNELHDFIKENKIALAHPDNIVDKKIFKLRIKTLPDSLIIHDFQEDQDWYY